MSVKIQVRRDTAANWTSNNPALLAGEQGFETDTGKTKFGDGSTAWTGLSYTTAPAAAHKDNHDPADGSDALDTANAAEISAVVAAGTGTSHSLARADHVHAINHGITDNHIVTIDGADIADNEYARFTADGLESRTASEVYTDLLGQVMLENDAIKLDPALSADGKYNGITETGTAGAILAFGDVVYLQTADSKWELAKADAEATCINKLGICVAAAAEDAATTILLIGKVRADAVFPSFTVGAPVFISAATAGDLTSTAPSTATNIIRCVGQATSADELWFSPDGAWGTVA